MLKFTKILTVRYREIVWSLDNAIITVAYGQAS